MPYFISAPHPPSERLTDAGRLPPWLPGVACVRVRVLDRDRVSLTALTESPEEDSASPVCSAKGCRTPAVWVLAWNNPKLHTPGRRKTWLACEEHREHLLVLPGLARFLKDVVTRSTRMEEEGGRSSSADG